MARTRIAVTARALASASATALLAGCGLLGGTPAESPQVVAERTERDARIRAEVEARLSAEPSIGAGRVRVDVEAGEVALHGGVPGFGALQCALRNAELTPGVRLVIDHLVLEPGPSRVQCLAPRTITVTPASSPPPSAPTRRR